MPTDIKLIDIIQEHLKAQGFHVSPGGSNTPPDVLLVCFECTHGKEQVPERGVWHRDVWRFEIKDRFVTINAGDALTILKVDGERQDKEVLDMADPESVKNLDQLLEAIKLSNKRSG